VVMALACRLTGGATAEFHGNASASLLILAHCLLRSAECSGPKRALHKHLACFCIDEGAVS
jgi:hypothetical protein